MSTFHLSYKILNRVLRGQDLIKIIIFAASSRTADKNRLKKKNCECVGWRIHLVPLSWFVPMGLHSLPSMSEHHWCRCQHNEKHKIYFSKPMTESFALFSSNGLSDSQGPADHTSRIIRLDLLSLQSQPNLSRPQPLIH